MGKSDFWSHIFNKRSSHFHPSCDRPGSTRVFGPSRLSAGQFWFIETNIKEALEIGRREASWSTPTSWRPRLLPYPPLTLCPRSRWRNGGDRLLPSCPAPPSSLPIVPRSRSTGECYLIKSYNSLHLSISLRLLASRRAEVLSAC